MLSQNCQRIWLSRCWRAVSRVSDERSWPRHPIYNDSLTGGERFSLSPESIRTGDIVGRYVAAGVTHAFLLSDGVFDTIDVPGAPFTAGRSISPQGWIVGTTPSAGRSRFLLQEGHIPHD